MSKYHFLVILLSVLAISAPLFRPGFFTSHDGELHLTRIARFSSLLVQGYLIPRWDPQLNSGLGYPLFIFTYPLPYYLASSFHLSGISVVNSLKTVFFLSNLLSAIFFYFWIYELTGSRVKSLASALLFIFIPYRFLNLYVRAALGEVVFSALLPFSFYALEKFIKHRNLFPFTVWILSLFFLFLTHSPMAFLFLPVMVTYALVRGLPVFSLLAGIVWSSGLAGFYLIPALGLTSAIKFTVTHRPWEHIPTLPQVLYSPWTFGFSFPGSSGSMSFQLGLVNWAILVISGILILRLNLLSKIIFTITLIAVFLMVSSPFGFWHADFAQFIQFPWRLLFFPFIFIPFLFSQLIGKVNLRTKIILICLVLAAIFTNRNHVRTNLPSFVSTPDTYFVSSTGTITSTPDELMPRSYQNASWLFTSSPLIRLGDGVSLIGFSLLILAYLTKIIIHVRQKPAFSLYYRQKRS
jgi:hypothetical protein